MRSDDLSASLSSGGDKNDFQYWPIRDLKGCQKQSFTSFNCQNITKIRTVESKNGNVGIESVQFAGAVEITASSKNSLEATESLVSSTSKFLQKSGATPPATGAKEKEAGVPQAVLNNRATSLGKHRSNNSTSPNTPSSNGTSAGKLSTLKTIEPAGLNSIAEDEWVEIDVAIDSGATETVMSEETLNGVIDIKESAACKRGIVYEVADGTQIPNLGERQFLGIMEDGSAKGVTAQVCAVNKTLMSVSKIANKGNRIVFDDDGSYIEHKVTGEKSWLTLSGGMYYLKMWVSRKSSAEAGF